MILVGSRITLRPLIDSDFNQYFKWHSDKEIRFQTAMHPFLVTEQNEREWFDKASRDISNKRFTFSIVYNKTKELIGYFQLTEVNLINRNAMLGIVIGENNFQGKGLGKEILDLGLGYGFDYLGLKKISLDVLEENTSGIKLYKNMGFIREGVLKKNYFNKGEFYDIIRMAIVKV